MICGLPDKTVLLIDVSDTQALRSASNRKGALELHIYVVERAFALSKRINWQARIWRSAGSTRNR